MDEQEVRLIDANALYKKLEHMRISVIFMKKITTGN